MTTVESDEWRSFCRDELPPGQLAGPSVGAWSSRMTRAASSVKRWPGLRPGGRPCRGLRAPCAHRVKFLLSRNLDVFYDEKQRGILWGTPQTIQPVAPCTPRTCRVAITAQAQASRATRRGPPARGGRRSRPTSTSSGSAQTATPRRSAATRSIDGLEEVANEASAKVRVNTLRATLVKANESLEKATQGRSGYEDGRVGRHHRSAYKGARDAGRGASECDQSAGKNEGAAQQAHRAAQRQAHADCFNA